MAEENQKYLVASILNYFKDCIAKEKTGNAESLEGINEIMMNV
jgi:hypothetical protein